MMGTYKGRIQLWDLTPAEKHDGSHTAPVKKHTNKVSHNIEYIDCHTLTDAQKRARKVILCVLAFILTACGCVALGFWMGVKHGGREAAETIQYQDSGQASSQTATPASWFGTSLETNMIDTRVYKAKEKAVATVFTTEKALKKCTDNLYQLAMDNGREAKMMSDADYDTLLHIVEAEAGEEDIKGRVLVANVILNRVKDPSFPDSVTDVVWDNSYGVPQFSPTYDGRISEVEITEDTKEAVRMALNGVDYSQGALFFVMRDAAEEDSMEWFDRDLVRLFQYGVHEFYTYPENVQGA